jgi:hypothetical protein
VISVGTGHDSVAEDVYREERFVLRVPEGTRKFTLAWQAAASAVPFAMKEMEVMPIRILAGNSVMQRTGGLGVSSIGQSFRLSAGDKLAGVAVPMSKSFSSREIPARLSCRLVEGKSDRGSWTVAAETVPCGYGGMTVFMGENPLSMGGDARFVLGSGIAEPRYYGWYDYEISWENPYKEGTSYSGETAEESSDLTFLAFTGIAAR